MIDGLWWQVRLRHADEETREQWQVKAQNRVAAGAKAQIMAGRNRGVKPGRYEVVSVVASRLSFLEP